MYKFLKGRLIFVRITLLAATLSLVAIGIVTIYGVGHPAEQTPVSQTTDLANKWQKQAVFAGIGIMGFLLVNLINYRFFGTFSYWLYAVIILLLGILLLAAKVDIPFVPLINGTRRWIKIKIIPSYDLTLQPSEFCKLIYIIAMAWYLRYRSNYRKFTALVGPFALTLLPMILILLEPDLGTVLLMMPILFVMLFVAGAKVKHLLIIIIMAILVSPFLWVKMNPYQRVRISSVLLQSQWLQEKAEEHPALGKILVGKRFSKKQWQNSWGYHLIRSKSAIASGRSTGYGYRKGPFVKYSFFLPERHNDFIFAIIAQQWGFWGCLGLLSLYVIIVICGVEIAIKNTDPFGRLLSVGIVAMFTVEVIVNVSMTLGLMPITGLTLPLVSYGGSSLLVTLTSIGLLNNVGRCRPFTVAPKQIG